MPRKGLRKALAASEEVVSNVHVSKVVQVYKRKRTTTEDGKENDSTSANSQTTLNGGKKNNQRGQEKKNQPSEDKAENKIEIRESLGKSGKLRANTQDKSVCYTPP